MRASFDLVVTFQKVGASMANILIVEEDQDLRDLVSQILEEANYNSVVKTEEQALAVISTLPFDLVIIGLLRPDKHATFVEKLVDQAPDVSVIGLADPVFDIEKLLAAVGEKVNRQRNLVCKV